MPGLVGIITRLPKERVQSELSAMLATQCHSPSYVTGTWVDDEHGVYIGWTARHGSAAAVMPLRSESGDTVLAFSGEEFPDPSVKSRLKDCGRRLKNLPAGYLVRLYEEDPSFPACLNGHFHGIVIDGTRQSSMLFNDRYGLHRLYYHQTKEAFYFAAEAKAILAVRPELSSVSPRSLGEFVSFKCVLENRTLFEGIQVLPPASAWILREGSVEKRAYFEPREWELQETLGIEDYYREVREVFSRNLPRYFSATQPLAVSLTGGLDTRMIMAWQRSSPGTLPCYSFGSTYRECQDVSIARRVAVECDQPYSVITVGTDFLSRFADYAERTVYLTDGCADVSRSADLYVNELAAQIAPIRMTGNYGGEILRRVRAFKPATLEHGLFNGDLLPEIARAGQTYAENIQCHPLSFSAFRQSPWHHYGLYALEQTQISVRSPYLDNDLVKTVFRAPQSSLADNGISIRLIRDGNPDLLKINTDRGLMGASKIPGLVLHAWLESTFKAEYAYDYGMPQWAVRIDRALRSLHLERLFLGRHKFYHYRVWYRDQLSPYIQEMLLDDRSLSRPYLKRKAVERAVKAHVSGTRNYTSAIHILLTLELLHRRFIDSQIAERPQYMPAAALARGA
jgi:asparagine synthase (glutamine-hydrolysing)